MARFTTSDGLSLYYEDTGDGPALLCLAGLTRNSRDFDFLAPHLPDTRLIRMDYRGRGRSDHDPDYSNYTVTREAQDVVELLDHLALDRVVILGTSRGGLIAMLLATTHPDRLAGVILNDVGPVLAEDGLIRIMESVGQPPAAKTHEQAIETMLIVQGQDFPGVSRDIWLTQSQAQFRETDDGLDLRYDPSLREALIEQAESGETPDLWPLFDSLAALPVGVIRGANSDVLSSMTLVQMEARHPGLITLTVPDRGHVPFLDEPESLKVIAQVMAAAA